MRPVLNEIGYVESFKTNLAILIEREKMSKAELARRIGTSHVTVGRYLEGTMFPTIDKLQAICGVFNTCINDLCGIGGYSTTNIDTIEFINDYNKCSDEIKKFIKDAIKAHLQNKQ